MLYKVNQCLVKTDDYYRILRPLVKIEALSRFTCH